MSCRWASTTHPVAGTAAPMHSASAWSCALSTAAAAVLLLGHPDPRHTDGQHREHPDHGPRGDGPWATLSAEQPRREPDRVLEEAGGGPGDDEGRDDHADLVSSGQRVTRQSSTWAKREKFRVNLIEAYDQPWKRQLEGTVGGYWGLIDAAQRVVKYPPGEPISNYPLWKLQMGCGMALSAFVFLAGWLTLRRRPWKPRLAAWIAVGTSATTAGMLLGLAADKMFYESYGARRLAAMGGAAGGRHRFTVAVRERCDVGTAAADFPRTARTARLPHQLGADGAAGSRADRHHADRGGDRARLCLRSALPRFSVRFADHGGGAVRGA